MLSDILWAIARSVFAAALLLILTRILGRKALSQMTFFDFTIVITFGSVAANIGIGGNNTFHTAVTVLITIGLIGLLIGIGHIKSLGFRKLVNSEPLVLIEAGKIVDANMKKARITIDELTSMLRGKNIFNISDAYYAVLENSGTLSVLPKAENRPLTPKDLQLKPPESGLTKDIIMDGVLMQENLDASSMTEAWLTRELNQHGISSVSEVFYAGLAPNGTLYISKRLPSGPEVHGQHGIE